MRLFTASSLLTHAREKHEAGGEDGVQFSRYNTEQKVNTSNYKHISVVY